MILKGSTTTWQDDIKSIKAHEYYRPGFNYISCFYTFTNENAVALCNRFKYNIRNGKILTIGGSGDQAFCFVLNEAEQIDIVDVNKLAYYLFVLKKAAILSLNNQHFIELIYTITPGFPVKKIDSYIIKDILSCVEEEDAHFFWNEIFNLFDLEEIRDLSRVDTIMYKDIVNYLPYNKESYEKIRNLIKEIKINYHIADLKKERVIAQDYDFIYFSNIGDYISHERIISLINYYVNRIKETSIIALFHTQKFDDVYDDFTTNYKKNFYKNHIRREYEHQSKVIKDFCSFDELNYLHTFTRRQK